MELVSVIIPTRNRPELVEVAIHFVLQQDYPNVETVVVADGSEPPFQPAVPDSRIRVIRPDHARQWKASFKCAGLAMGRDSSWLRSL